jgi:hypothetical protein
LAGPRAQIQQIFQVPAEAKQMIFFPVRMFALEPSDIKEGNDILIGIN